MNKIRDLKQTGIVKKYLNKIDRVNVYSSITDHHVINILLNAITTCLCYVIFYYKDLCSGTYKYKDKLSNMDFTTTEL